MNVIERLDEIYAIAQHRAAYSPEEDAAHELAAGWMREAASKRPEVIKALLAHAAAERVLIQCRRLVAGYALPRRTRVTLPASGRRLTINAAVSGAVKIWVIR